MRWGQVAVTSLKNLCPDINNIDLKRDYITTPINSVLSRAKVSSRGKAAKQAVCDRGYRGGKREVNGNANRSTWKSIKTRHTLPNRQEAETMQKARDDWTHYRPLEIGFTECQKLPERRHWWSHQSTDGCCCLESKAMAIGHFLILLLPAAKTADFENSLMQKDQIAWFCLY